MKRKDVVRGSVFCVLVAVIILGGIAVKAEAGIIRLSMANFAWDGYSNPDYFKSFASGYIEGGYNSGGFACLVAPVPFPTTALTVKSVVVYVNDEATGGFLATMYGVDMANGAVTYLGEVYSPGNSTSIEALTIPITKTTPKLNKNYQYYLGICVYDNQYFYGAQITY